MSHKKRRETKQQPSMLPGPAVPCCCLVSFCFLCDIHSIHSVQCSCSGWPTGNGKKRSRSQAQLGQATCLSVAKFLSISCGPSWARALYITSLDLTSRSSGMHCNARTWRLVKHLLNKSFIPRQVACYRTALVSKEERGGTLFAIDFFSMCLSALSSRED